MTDHPANTPASGGDDLWCMHIQGPDDLHAAPDFWTALAWAAELNTFIAEKAIKGNWAADDNYPLSQATVRRWIGTRESHAVHVQIELADRAEHEAKRKEAAALAAQPPKPDGGVVPLERVRHVKRGTEYEVLGEAEAQIASNQAESDRFGNWRGLYEGHKLTVYRSVDTGKLWCRYTDEFRDGRFVAAPPLNTGPEVGGGKLAIAVTALLERFERYRASDKSHYDAHNCFVGDSGAYKIWDAIKSALASARLTPAASRPVEQGEPVAVYRDALQRLHSAIHALSKFEGKKTLFEASLYESDRALAAWQELNGAQVQAAAALSREEADHA